MKEFFAFMVHDNDEITPVDGCMFYTREENKLVPVSEDFERGFSSMSYEQGIEFLKDNKIKTVTTLNVDSGRVASAPYDVTDDDDFEECEEDGEWYKHRHEGAFKGSELEQLLQKSGVKVKVLNQEEERTFTENLEYCYELS
jgi:hypothetical protein